MTEIVAVPQLCGTCQHDHHGPVPALGQLPPCPRCGCADFILDPTVVEAAAAADDAEAGDYPNGRLLSGEMAQGLAGVVRALEQHITDEYGWDSVPMIGALYAGPRARARAGGAAVFSVEAAALDLSYARLLERVNGDPNVVAEVLAGMAENRPSLFDLYRVNAGMDPRDPVMAWWATYEAWERSDGGERPGSANTDPSLRADEIRQVVCVDVDERVHEVTRLRSRDTACYRVAPFARYQQQFSGQSRFEAPPVTGALLRLVRVTRCEALLRGIGRNTAGGNA